MPDGNGDWRLRLKQARLQLRVTQAELARSTGTSYEAIRAYEGGKRRPSAARLEALIEALKIPNADANRIRESAGFAPVHDIRTGPLERNRFYQRDEFDAVVETVPWPEFVVNDPVEVLAVNRAAEALWRIDFAHERSVRTRAQMNLLSVAGERDFAARVKNWDEAVGILVSMFKANTPAPQSMDEATPYFEEVMKQFASGDPQFLARLIDVWVRTEPMQGKVRWTYPIVWDDPDERELRFLATVSLANDEESTYFNDWIPRDAETWLRLEALKLRHARDPQATPGRHDGRGRAGPAREHR